VRPRRGVGAHAAGASVRDLVTAAGLTVTGSVSMSEPGISIHEVGGARMGTDPENSVVDPLCRCWEDPRMVIVDDACWPTSAYQNATLTMMAIALRAATHLIPS